MTDIPNPARTAEHGRNLVQPGDARDLLLQLYRDIGISAVAAALNARKSAPAAVTVLLRPKRDDLAA